MSSKIKINDEKPGQRWNKQHRMRNKWNKIK